MLRRILTTHDSNNGAILRDALRAGLTALKDPQVEARVREYFEKNPGYNRDAVHVAAITCRFAAERTSPDSRICASTGTKPHFPKP